MQTDASQREALRRFADAVRAFSDDPGPLNLERYLAASRTLDEAYRRPQVERRRRSRAA